MQRIREWLIPRCFSMDPRSLGVFRIAYATLLLGNLWSRSQGIDGWYTAGCAVVYFVFLLGYRTKLSHALSLLSLVSVHSRISLLENGGDMVMRLLCLYTLFLPLGARFSIDSLLASMRHFDEQTPADLANRGPSSGTTAPFVHLVVLAIQLQWTLIFISRPFSYGMMCFVVLLIHKAHWDALFRCFRKNRAERVVFYDADCGVCLLSARLLARLDRLQLLRLESNENVAAFPEGITPELVNNTIVVFDTGTKQTWTRADALAAIIRMLPLGSLWSLPLRLPGFKQLANAFYDRFAANRLDISVWLGLSACGVPTDTPGPALPRADNSSSASMLWSRIGYWTSTAMVALLMVALYGEMVRANASILRWMRYP